MRVVQFALLAILMWCCFPAFSQSPRTDTLKINAINRDPSRDTIPARRPAFQLKPIRIAVDQLKLRTNWRSSFAFGVNINQGSFSNNWSGGGVTSLALGGILNYKTDYNIGDRNYVTEVALQYGKLKNKNQLQRKTADRIFWDNKVGLKLSKNWNFFGSLNFESQFDKGYSYSKTKAGDEVRTLISKFMSPGYLTESVGFEFKPDKSFSLRIGTGTARQTFVLDTALSNKDSKNFGVVRGRRFRNELAFQIVSSLEREIMENVGLKTRYAMFANYERLNNIDHRLDVMLNAKVNKLINVSLSGIAIYDDDASTKIQASQSLALGIIFKLTK